MSGTDASARASPSARMASSSRRRASRAGSSRQPVRRLEAPLPPVPGHRAGNFRASVLWPSVRRRCSRRRSCGVARALQRRLARETRGRPAPHRPAERSLCLIGGAAGVPALRPPRAGASSERSAPETRLSASASTSIADAEPPRDGEAIGAARHALLKPVGRRQAFRIELQRAVDDALGLGRQRLERRQGASLQWSGRPGGSGPERGPASAPPSAGSVPLPISSIRTRVAAIGMRRGRRAAWRGAR